MPNIVHTCRFSSWVPSAVNAVAFNKSGNRLVIARANGDIELWTLQNDDNQFEDRYIPDMKLDQNQIDQYIDSYMRPFAKNTFASSTQWYCEKIIAGSTNTRITGVFWALRSNKLSTSFESDTDSMDRLFTVAMNGKIIEWDIESGVPLSVSDSFGGPIWCGALSPSTTQLIVGCNDGTLRLFDISDSTSAPLYRRAFYRHSGRVLSIDWLQNPKYYINSSARITKEDGTPLTSRDDPPLVVSGGSDGLIRTWNIATNRNLCQISVDSQTVLVNNNQLFNDATNANNGLLNGQLSAEFDDSSDDDDEVDLFGASTSVAKKKNQTSKKTKKAKTIVRGARVWAVRFLDSRTIVSGDSTGAVQIHETRFATTVKTFHVHKADVLSLSVVPPFNSFSKQDSPDVEAPRGKDSNASFFPTVFATGVDSNVIQIQAVAPSESADTELEHANDLTWFTTESHRLHSHDVTAMAVSPAIFSADHNAIAEAARRNIINSVQSSPDSKNFESQMKKATTLADYVHSRILSQPRKFEIILVTGSIDTQIIFYSCSRFRSIAPRKVAPFPHRSNMNFSQITSDAPTLSQESVNFCKHYSLGIYAKPTPKSDRFGISFTDKTLNSMLSHSQYAPYVFTQAPADARSLMYFNKKIEVSTLGRPQEIPSITCETDFNIPHPFQKKRPATTSLNSHSKKLKTSTQTFQSISKDPRVLTQMEVATTLNLVTATISPNGALIACADPLSIKLFALQAVEVVRNDTIIEIYQVKKLVFPPALDDSIDYSEEYLNAYETLVSTGAQSLTFSPDNSTLTVTVDDGYVYIVDLVLGHIVSVIKNSSVRYLLHQIVPSLKVAESIKPTMKDSDDSDDDLADSDDESEVVKSDKYGSILPKIPSPIVQQVKYSFCGKYFATLDSNQSLRVFNIIQENNVYSIRHLCSLPALNSFCSSFAFLPKVQFEEIADIKTVTKVVPAKTKSASNPFAKKTPLATASESSLKDKVEMSEKQAQFNECKENLKHPSIIGALSSGKIFVFDTNRRSFIEASTRIGDSEHHYINLPFDVRNIDSNEDIRNEVYGNAHVVRQGAPNLSKAVSFKTGVTSISVSQFSEIQPQNALGPCINALVTTASMVFKVSIPVSIFYPDAVVYAENNNNKKSIKPTITALTTITPTPEVKSKQAKSSKKSSTTTRETTTTTNIETGTPYRPYIVINALPDFKQLLHAAFITPSSTSLSFKQNTTFPMPQVAVVEVSWLDILKTLPPTLRLKKFGRT